VDPQALDTQFGVRRRAPVRGVFNQRIGKVDPADYGVAFHSLSELG